MKRRGLEMIPEIQMRTADLELIGKNRRTDKTHVSQVLKAMKEAAGENVGQIEGETNNYRAQMGFLFERALEQAWKDYWFVEADEIVWQLALEYEGLLGTPDGLDLRNNRLVSVKLTWRSARKWEEDFQTHFKWWLAQEMAYAKMMVGSGVVTEPIHEALYIVGFAAGDYRGPWRLGVYTDVVTWEWPEVEDNWQALQNWRKWLEEEKANG